MKTKVASYAFQREKSQDLGDIGQGPEISIMINSPNKQRYRQYNRRDSILRQRFHFKGQEGRK